MLSAPWTYGMPDTPLPAPWRRSSPCKSPDQSTVRIRGLRGNVIGLIRCRTRSPGTCRTANLDKDYPDRATKPVDNPYGPYANPFPIEQHRLGPFKPIEAFYAKLKSSK
jgi:hypothetical protein